MGAGMVCGGLIVAIAGWLLDLAPVDEAIAFSPLVGSLVTVAGGVVFLIVGLLRRR
jgi:hypothetical protein